MSEPGDGELLERFVGQRDESAFAALVQRHGSMVLGVCRRVLNDWQRTEDAFQVTFLVLARKAGSLARPESLANWLHGVAYRIALKARIRVARQRTHERQAAAMSPTESQPSGSARELREVLDKEIDRLPEKYRAPLVLCYLEGKTNEEAWRHRRASPRLVYGVGQRVAAKIDRTAAGQGPIAWRSPAISPQLVVAARRIQSDDRGVTAFRQRWRILFSGSAVPC
jgi:RNA polymerase sigma factor (sigma-70 family)